MLHQQNRQNDRGPDEATTEGLGPWNRVASGPESSSTESSDLAMGDAVSRVRSSEARWVWWVWRVAFCLSHAPITYHVVVRVRDPDFVRMKRDKQPLSPVWLTTETDQCMIRRVPSCDQNYRWGVYVFHLGYGGGPACRGTHESSPQ
ncbi:hypothetical protein THAOC_29891, partial [Thalassiosira oceanica]